MSDLKQKLDPLAKELDQVRAAIESIRDDIDAETEDEQEIVDALDTAITHLEDAYAILSTDLS